jgi:hypothetical protein
VRAAPSWWSVTAARSLCCAGTGCEPDLLAAFDVRALRPGGWFVLQHSRRAAVEAAPASWVHVHTKRFGDTCIEFWRQSEAGTHADGQEESHGAT